ncbi:MAG: protein kinase domain-containing protein [Parasphingopyxis sp.]|uniref:serine/threonine-protein kinase n=1 Tax=Parasphingopyxis sp. TaxID=1920299 RepID=UPI003FA0295A
MEVSVDARALTLLEEALRYAPEKRKAFVRREAGDDDALCRRVFELLGAVDEQSDRLPTGGGAHIVGDAPAPDRIGAYRIAEKLGEGGMGAVYRAVRDRGDFDHEVAIKIVRPDVLGGALKDRFERERQLLAGLSHPHIARLYDGGTMDGGNPYIVMELIDGVPVDRWVGDHDLDRQARLALFEQICGAVRYAHQNLVIHRDITPANVLVTPDGQPKLIDFGIAKPTEQEQAEAQPGRKLVALSMTPGFAAPERRYGAPATTLTDIYSLGKLLALFVAPDEDDRDVAAVIGRAAAEKPEERYRSVDALIDDVERLRDGRPVAAREGGRAYHVGKFLKRQKYAVGAIAAFIVLLIGALVTTSIGFRQARVAQIEAEERLADTREMAGTMMFDVFDEVSERPGNSHARLLIARTAQRYLTQIAEDPDASVEARLEAGRGFHRLANATGALDTGNSGDLIQGVELLERAVAMLEQVMAEAPSDEARFALANVYTSLARDKGLTFIDVQSTLPDLESAAQLLAEIENQSAEVIAARGRTQRYMGDFLACCYDQAQRGLREIQRGLSLIEGASPPIRADPEVRRAYNDLTNLRGGFRRFLDNDEEGTIITFYQAMNAQRELTEETHAAGDYRLLTTIAINLGRTLLRVDRPAEADRVLSLVHRETRELLTDDPTDNDLQRRMSYVLVIRALAAANVGDRERAERYLRDGLRLARQAERPIASAEGSQLNYAHRLQEASDAQWALGDRDSACRTMRRSVAIYRAYSERWDLPTTTLRYRMAPMAERLRECPAAS